MAWAEAPYLAQKQAQEKPRTIQRQAQNKAKTRPEEAQDKPKTKPGSCGSCGQAAKARIPVSKASCLEVGASLVSLDFEFSNNHLPSFSEKRIRGENGRANKNHSTFSFFFCQFCSAGFNTEIVRDSAIVRDSEIVRLLRLLRLLRPGCESKDSSLQGVLP